MKRFVFFIATLVVVIILPVLSRAQVARLVHYQGVLGDSDGNAVTDSVDLQFSIYHKITDTKPVWTETHKDVYVSEDGSYDVLLGSENPLKLSWYEYYLGVKKAGDEKEYGRKMIVGSGYNYRMSFLVAAYTIVWVVLFAYMFMISKKQKRIIAELQQVSALQDK